MDEFLEWLKENKISANGKYKGKRQGSVTKSQHDEWHIRICVQYDEFLDTVLANETIAMQELAKRLILFRMNAIKDGRIPKCSYIKIAKQGETLKPCAVCKVCDPKCKAMKKC